MSPDLDLHCQRINRSATNMSLKPLMAAEQIEALALEGVGKFDGRTAIYIKQMYWAEHGTASSVVAADPESTRDRNSDVSGKSVSVSVNHGGRGRIKKTIKRIK